MDKLSNIMFADFGNSRVKIWGKEASTISYHKNWTDEIRVDEYEKCYYSSVNVGESEKAKNKYKNIIWIDVGDLLNEYSNLDFSEISGMGTDRKLGLIGGCLKYGIPLITIDSGTALTINVVDENKKCLGGFILPGIQTQLKSLSDYGSALPRASVNEKEYSLGKNTNEAISVGVLHGIAGSIEYHLDKIKKMYFDESDKLNIIITGGNRELLHQILSKTNNELICDGDLLYLGLRRIARLYKK